MFKDTDTHFVKLSKEVLVSIIFIKVLKEFIVHITYAKLYI